MTTVSATTEKLEPIHQEVRNYIDANLYSLQQARLDKRTNATLADLFKSRNPYYLRSTRKVAYQLVSYCLDDYLLSADEILFANFARETSATLARRGQQLLEPATILELFAQDDLPLMFELLSAYSRASNRLLYRFYTDFCDEDSLVDWVRLTRFMSNG